MTRRLDCKWKKLDNHHLTIVELDGQIDSSKGMEPVEEIAASEDTEHVAVQMGGVTYINSSGCGGLIALHHKLAGRGFHLFLVGLVGGVERVIKHVGCHKIMRVRESLEEVIEEVDALKPE